MKTYDQGCEDLALSFLEDTPVWDTLTKKTQSEILTELSTDIQFEIEQTIDWYHLDD